MSTQAPNDIGPAFVFSDLDDCHDTDDAPLLSPPPTRLAAKMPPKRYDYGQCPQFGDHCAEFVLLTNNQVSVSIILNWTTLTYHAVQGPVCHCGHAKIVHSIEHPADLGLLPIKGGCKSSGCVSFCRVRPSRVLATLGIH
jgi:hypothetical protein